MFYAGEAEDVRAMKSFHSSFATQTSSWRKVSTSHRSMPATSESARASCALDTSATTRAVLEKFEGMPRTEQNPESGPLRRVVWKTHPFEARSEDRG